MYLQKWIKSQIYSLPFIYFTIIKNPATFLFAGFCSRFDEITSLLVAQFQLNTPVFHPVFFGFAII